MQFYQFWARADRVAQGQGGTFPITCHGYSNDSLEEAFRVAEQRANSTIQAIEAGRPLGNEYYGIPFREEIVEKFSDEGRTVAVISRNRYGVLVLNTPEVLFADVDKPSTKAPTEKFSLMGLFRKKTPPPSFESQLIDRIQSVCENDRNIGLRLYRTKAGYRIVLTSQTIPAREAKAKNLLRGLGSDRLYVNLCLAQDCYRARLTPKPWRCGFRRPIIGFPFRSPNEEQQFRSWTNEYDQKRQGFATCALIGEFGSQSLHPMVENIVQLHDHYTLDGESPLA